MAKKKKARGRPVTRKYAPRIDASAEEIAATIFSMPADHEWQYEKEAPDYRCLACDKSVHYPDTLRLDGLCETCHRRREDAE